MVKLGNIEKRNNKNFNEFRINYVYILDYYKFVSSRYVRNDLNFLYLLKKEMLTRGEDTQLFVNNSDV